MRYRATICVDVWADKEVKDQVIALVKKEYESEQAPVFDEEVPF